MSLKKIDNHSFLGTLNPNPNYLRVTKPQVSWFDETHLTKHKLPFGTRVLSSFGNIRNEQCFQGQNGLSSLLPICISYYRKPLIHLETVNSDKFVSATKSSIYILVSNPADFFCF